MDYLFRGGDQSNEALLADAKSFGIELPVAISEPQNFSLWEDHWPVVELFMRCMTQWRGGPSGVIGLDYGVVLQMANLYSVKNLPDIMEELQVMEVHARNLINKQTEREA